MQVAVGRHALADAALVAAHARIAHRARRRVDERQRLLLDKRAEAETKVLGDVAHAGGKQLTELAQLVLVDVHRVGEVHEKVEIDRIVFGELIGDVEAERCVFKSTKSKQVSRANLGPTRK